MFWPCFKSLGLIRARLVPYHHPLMGFSGEKVHPLGMYEMDVQMGDEWPKRLTQKINFFVMDENVFSAYNLIIGRVALKEFEAIPSTVHQMLKFLTPYGVGEV